MTAQRHEEQKRERRRAERERGRTVYRGLIWGAPSGRTRLESLGVVIVSERLNEHTGEWDVECTPEALDRIDTLWGDFAWSLSEETAS